MKILAIGDFQGTFPKKLRKKLEKEDFDLVVGVGDYTGLSIWLKYVYYSLKTGKEGKERKTAEEFFGKKKYKQLRKKDWEAGKKILSEINRLKKPGLIIFGNTDWYRYPFERKFVDEFEKKRTYDDYIKKLKNLSNINYKKKKHKGINFIGFGGYMDIDAYFDKKQWKEAKKDKMLKKRIGRREKNKKKLLDLINKTTPPRIFVFHYPPKGAFDIIRAGKENPMNGKSAGIGFFTEAIKKHKPLLALCGHMHEYQGKKLLHGVPVINPGDAEAGKAAIITLPENNKGKLRVKFIK